MEALVWWRDALELVKSENRPWQEVGGKVCRVFVDAASTPAYCAAVAFIDGQRFYTAMAPPAWLSKQFAERRDKQITTLVRRAWLCILFVCWQEIIAILLALGYFKEQLRNRRVVLYSDNKGPRVCAMWCLVCAAFGVALQGQSTQRPKALLALQIITGLFARYGLWP